MKCSSDFFNLSHLESCVCTRHTHRYASRVQSRVKRRNWRDPRAIASLQLANEIIIKSSSPQSSGACVVLVALQPAAKGEMMPHARVIHAYTQVAAGAVADTHGENGKKVSFAGPHLTRRCRWLPRSCATQLLRDLSVLSLYMLGKRSAERLHWLELYRISHPPPRAKFASMPAS